VKSSSDRPAGGTSTDSAPGSIMPGSARANKRQNSKGSRHTGLSMSVPNTAASVAFLMIALTNANTRAGVLAAPDTFTPERYLSTKTPYAYSTPPADGVPLDELGAPQGCEPMFVYLLSRHGTRYPTKGKMRLGSGLAPLIGRARAPALQDWRYVFANESHMAGQLHRVGVEELRGLGQRYAARFPSIFADERLVNPIASTSMMVRSTQKPRCTTTAISYMQGFTTSAFTLTMLPLDADPLLRFFDVCPAYEQYKDAVGECLKSWKEGVWAGMVPSVTEAMQLTGEPLAAAEVGALWALCQQEAMLGRTDWACALFTPAQLRLLEWVEDVEALEEKAYGSCLSYQIATPLLRDAASTIERAASRSADELPLPRAVLNFAHAETIIPYSSLLSMFGSPGACSLRSCGLGAGAGASCQAAGWSPSVQLPSQAGRTGDGGKHTADSWRGAIASPYGANVAHILYSCPSASSARHLVRTVYNEHVVPLKGCRGKLDCALDDFLAIAGSLADDAELSVACEAWNGCADVGSKK